MSGLILAMKTVTEQLSSVGDDGYIYSNQAHALGKKGNQRDQVGALWIVLHHYFSTIASHLPFFETWISSVAGV